MHRDALRDGVQPPWEGFEAYGLLLVFGAVFLEQLGPPLPSGPLLIVAGALANEGRLSMTKRSA